jgi:hypothetical protein
MKKSIFAITLLLASSLSYANDASHVEAEKLLQSMGMEKAFEQSMVQMLNVQLQQNPAMAPFRGVMQKFFKKYMSFNSMKPELIALYAQTFTAVELKAINTFYQTPVGKKSIEKMPELMGKGAQIGARKVQENMQELQQMIQAEAERIKQAESK